jgi:predicted nuclease of predicted toxin-antitoxin system
MVRFKVDENLPLEVASLLTAAGHDALTVLDQLLGGHSDLAVDEACRHEGRAIVTLDLDFTDI